MVSLVPSFQIKGERTPFIGKGRPLFLVNFQCEIASHKGKKFLSLKMWGLHLSLSCNFLMWDCLPQKKKKS